MLTSYEYASAWLMSLQDRSWRLAHGARAPRGPIAVVCIAAVTLLGRNARKFSSVGSAIQ
jgi:hypothetical protein